MKKHLIIFGLGVSLISGTCVSALTEDGGELVIRSAREIQQTVGKQDLLSLQKRLESQGVWEEFKKAKFDISKWL